MCALVKKVVRVFNPKPKTDRAAEIEGPYRYSLTRVWDRNKPTCTWIMLNPSTADSVSDDPTIRRCVGFATAWKYGAIRVVNLFAYRSTDPEALEKVEDPVGPRNDEEILRAVREAGLYAVVAAWGARKFAEKRAHDVMNMLRAHHVLCLKTSKDGAPWHPLYVKGDVTPKLYNWRP